MRRPCEGCSVSRLKPKRDSLVTGWRTPTGLVETTPDATPDEVEAFRQWFVSSPLPTWHAWTAVVHGRVWTYRPVTPLHLHSGVA
jgi:hypothetical protein